MVSNFVFASLSHEVLQPLHKESFALERPRVRELENEENSLLPNAASAGVGLSLKDHWTLVYIAKTPQLGFVDSFSVMKRNPLSSKMMVRRQSKKVTKTCLNEEGVKVATQNLANRG